MNSHFFRGALLALGLSALFTVGASAAYEGVATVTGDTLNLRAEPNTESAVLAAALKDDVVLVVEQASEGWYKVDYCTIEGYMSADWLTVADTYDAPLCYGLVDTDGSTLNLRAAPSTDSEKLASLPSGTILPLNAMEQGWFKTEYNGTEGYVSGEYILAVDGSGTRADGTVVPPSDLAQQIIDYAKGFLGTPYVYGASGPNSFDCSGFTSYVYNHFGYSLNRSAAGQLSNGTAVDLSNIQPGDIICWKAYGSSKAATHVGIYIGNDQYIHASTTGSTVRINEMDYAAKSRYVVGVRRII